jgi:hypothetical protein
MIVYFRRIKDIEIPLWETVAPEMHKGWGVLSKLSSHGLEKTTIPYVTQTSGTTLSDHHDDGRRCWGGRSLFCRPKCRGGSTGGE